ncbi:MAG: hypothetical protein ACE5LU_18335 [Anaerolineae bacterium]
MRDELLMEVLAAHADHLNEEGDHTQAYLDMFPEDRQTLAPLFALAKQLKMILAPVEMSLAFRAELHTGLLQTAEESLPASAWRSRFIFRPRLPERLLDLPVFMRLPSPPNRQVLVRAAAGGAGLAAAGVAAYVLHSKRGIREELERN